MIVLICVRDHFRIDRFRSWLSLLAAAGSEESESDQVPWQLWRIQDTVFEERSIRSSDVLESLLAAQKNFSAPRVEA